MGSEHIAARTSCLSFPKNRPSFPKDRPSFPKGRVGVLESQRLGQHPICLRAATHGGQAGSLAYYIKETRPTIPISPTLECLQIILLS